MDLNLDPRLSVSASIQSSEIIRSMDPKTRKDKLMGLCRREPLTMAGRRIQRIKILSLTLLPILGLWCFAVNSFIEKMEGKQEVEQTQYAVKFSVKVGKLLNYIQRERDMSVLYLSILGPGTKTFLINEYLLTDQALDDLTDWPANSAMDSFFHTKESFRTFLGNHRQSLDPATFDIFAEIDFYNKLIEKFVHWMYGAIRESKRVSVWKILVSYQKIVTGMEQLGIERALGVVFYINGGFPTKKLYGDYNNNVNSFKANYRSAMLYSKEIDPIFQKGMTSSGKNLTKIIEKFRFEIQHGVEINSSIVKTQWWFDNMTLYLDTHLLIQIDLALLIDTQLQEIIKSEKTTLIVYGISLVVVILMCPVIVRSVEMLTTSIQQIAVNFVYTTKSLMREQRRFEATLTNLLPRSVMSKLSRKTLVKAEYFQSVTVMSSEIFAFNRFMWNRPIVDVVQLLESLYNSIEEALICNDLFKFEAINDYFIIASGFDMQQDDQSAANVANFALDLLDLMSDQHIMLYDNQRLHFRIAIHTGPCMAGVVGAARLRFGLYGDTVMIARELQHTGLPGRINISLTTQQMLLKTGMYATKNNVMSIGCDQTFWLLGRHNRKPTGSIRVHLAEESDVIHDEEIPCTSSD